MVEKKLFYQKVFTRALTDKDEKLVKRIRTNSGAQVRIIGSREREETVVLRGPVKLN